MREARSPDAHQEVVDVDVGAGRADRRWRILPVSRYGDVAVGVGAIVGANMRYLITVLSQQQVPHSFPTGTLVINLLGCFAIGIMQTLFLELLRVRRELHLFVSVGLLGGFTTFSTFSVETVQLVGAGRFTFAAAYQALSLVGGLLGVLGGIMLAHRAYPRWQRRRKHAS